MKAKNSNLNNMGYWDKLLQNLPQSYRDWFEEERKFLREFIKKDSKVLEVGCGEGRSLRDIIDITQNLTGIDHDGKAVDDAKKIFVDYNKVKVLVASAEDMPFREGEFDYVICMNTFANFGEKRMEIIEEMKRVLKNTGSIVISVFGENALEERMKVYKKIGVKIKEVKKDGTVIFDGWTGDNTSEQFSKDRLLEIFKKANLKVEQIKKVGIAYICETKKAN